MNEILPVIFTLATRPLSDGYGSTYQLNTYHLDLQFELKRDGGAQWLSGRVLDSGPRGRGFEPHRRHCVVSLSKNIYSSLVLVQPRKTRPA